MSAIVLATIGYEKATLAEVIDRLRAASVEVVIDVRAIAGSRRAGFSKTLLSASLGEAGIGYRHLRGLGTPKPGRQAARAGLPPRCTPSTTSIWPPPRPNSPLKKPVRSPQAGGPHCSALRLMSINAIAPSWRT